MMSSSVVTIRMDSEVKKQAQAIFSEFGLDMTTAMNLYVRQVIRERAIPFRIGFNDLPDRHSVPKSDMKFATDAEVETFSAALIERNRQAYEALAK